MDTGTAIKLFFGGLVGIALIDTGLNGLFGSLLGAIVRPDDMVEEPTTPTGSTPNVAPGGTQTGNTPAGTTSSQTLSPAQIAQYAKKAGFTGYNLIVAIAVAEGESGGRVGAYNGGNGTTDIENSCGLWQINVLAHPNYDRNKLLNDAAYNAKAAFQLWQASGWHPWGAYTNGSYLTYLPIATTAAITVGG